MGYETRDPPEAKEIPRPEAKEIPRPEAKETPQPEAKEIPQPEAKETPQPEAKETLQPEAREQRRLSPAGQRAMQGQDVYTPRPDDVNFTDRQGRPITVRTFPGSEQTYIRAYDRTQRVPPEHLDTKGQAGYANLRMERGPTGDTRARLEDIQTMPSYRGNGIGDVMLGQGEKAARKNGASEIYGVLSYTPKDEAAVRQFYRDHHYSTRPGPQGGDEVYKKL